MVTTPHWILDPACPKAGEHQALVQWTGWMGCTLLAPGRDRTCGGGRRPSADRRAVRFKRRPRTPYTVTDRKRAAARRWQQRQRYALPLLAELVAERQPPIDQVMQERVRTWNASEQSTRDWHAERWRRSRRILETYDPGTRRVQLDYWNTHRWRPAEASYLLDMLSSFEKGRLIVVDRHLEPARITISVAEVTAVGFGRKPVARGWLGPPA